MASSTLVVCYSRTETTSRLGTYLANQLDADFERIEEPGSRMGVGGYMRSAFEALGKGLPTIRTRRDPRDYELVVIGTPVWVQTMAAPIRSYLALHQGKLHNAAFFAVMGGAGADKVISELKLACDAPKAVSRTFLQRDVERDAFRAACDSFADELKREVGQLARASVAARAS